MSIFEWEWCAITLLKLRNIVELGNFFEHYQQSTYKLQYNEIDYIYILAEIILHVYLLNFA